MIKVRETENFPGGIFYQISIFGLTITGKLISTTGKALHRRPNNRLPGPFGQQALLIHGNDNHKFLSESAIAGSLLVKYYTGV